MLTAAVICENYLEKLFVNESEWRIAEKVCKFLEGAASASKHQSESQYVALIVTSGLFAQLQAAYKDYTKKCVESVAAAMLKVR